MTESFRQLINRLKDMPLQRVCVARAGAEAVLETMKDALEEGIAQPVLVGDQELIWRMACKVSLNLNMVEVVQQPDPEKALPLAADLVISGQADVLMKGTVKNQEFLETVSSREGLGLGSFLSHLAAFQIPDYDRLVHVTDGGLNEYPDFDEKVNILKNAISFLQSLGIETPRVAVLSANEKVSPKMPVTVEAQKLSDMARQGLLKGALVEGPMALDVAVSREAARHKGISDSVASNADLLFVPSVEVGNLLEESIVHFARGKMAAVLLGAQRPVVPAQESEGRFGRLCSMALACYSSALSGRQG